MNSRDRTVVLVIVLLIAGAWFFHRPAGHQTADHSPSVAPTPAAALAHPDSASGGIARPPPIGAPLAPLASVIPPGVSLPPPPQGAAALAVRQLDQINLMLRDYRTLFGSNPIGTNAEIMRAVMGDNPKKARLGPPEGMSLNENGELVDPWGTPFFFHQLSGDHMEIHSAGPDKRMWTNDDLVHP